MSNFSNFSRSAARPNSEMIIEKKLWPDCFKGTSLEGYSQNEPVIVISLIDAKVFPKNTPVIENIIINENMRSGSYVNVGYESSVEMLIIHDVFFKDIFDEVNSLFKSLEESSMYRYIIVFFYDDDDAYEKTAPSDVFYCRYDYHYKSILTNKNHSMILLPIDKELSYIMNTREKMDRLSSRITDLRNDFENNKEEVEDALKELEGKIDALDNDTDPINPLNRTRRTLY